MTLSQTLFRFRINILKSRIWSAWVSITAVLTNALVMFQGLFELLIVKISYHLFG